jgi:hypothetical protein
MFAVHPIPPQEETSAQRVRLAAEPAANEPHAHEEGNPLVPTIFHERWWLDAATQRHWEAAEVLHGARCVGWMPYTLSGHRGFRVSVMPRLAHLLGPAIDAGTGTANTRWLRRLGILQELVQQVPKVALFSQTCHPDLPDVLGFQVVGFESFVQFSAEVAAQPESAAWSGLRDKTRNVIRRARERAGIETLTDPSEFARFYLSNLARTGDHSYFDAGRIAPLYEAAHSRGRARIVGARVKGGRLAAAVFYVWDDRRVWYFLSTRDAACASNGVVSLLVWEGMRMAGERGLVFDFDGIASEGAARFYSGFGARICPRFAIYRRSTAYALFTTALAALRGRGSRNYFTAP